MFFVSSLTTLPFYIYMLLPLTQHSITPKSSYFYTPFSLFFTNLQPQETQMAKSLSISSSLLMLILFLMFSLVFPQPYLSHDEQEGVYKVLESLNPEYPWRKIYPDDLCFSAPHGVVCDFFQENDTLSSHIVELNFGYVSDYSPNPPCSASATLNAAVLSPFRHLKKLFFYECFTVEKVEFPDLPLSLGSLEELSFIENPGLVGPMRGSLVNLRSLRRIVLIGSNVSGNIPDGFDFLTNLEQVTLSRNMLNGVVWGGFGKLRKLRVLDLSQNRFEGNISESIGGLKQLLKLDLSFNNFSGEFPENFRDLKELEFLDVSYNNLGEFGVPLVLGEMESLKEVYLSGNYLGGVIPEIWEKLGGLLAIGLSGTGLIGRIPSSMGLNMKRACYIGLDNNKLEGTVPSEFEVLEFVNELNLENNNFSGKVPFSLKFVSKLEGKLKLEGNPQLCIDESLKSAKVGGYIGQLKVCSHEYEMFKSAVPISGSTTLLHVSAYLLVLLGLLSIFL